MQIITMIVDETGVINSKSVPVSFNGDAAKAVIKCNANKTDVDPSKVVAYFDNIIIIVDDKDIEVYNYHTMDLMHSWHVRDCDYFVRWFNEYNKEK